MNRESIDPSQSCPTRRAVEYLIKNHDVEKIQAMEDQFRALQALYQVIIPTSEDQIAEAEQKLKELALMIHACGMAISILTQQGDLENEQ